MADSLEIKPLETCFLSLEWLRDRTREEGVEITSELKKDNLDRVNVEKKILADLVEGLPKKNRDNIFARAAAIIQDILV